jgi:Family of unknown function (DUF6527)
MPRLTEIRPEFVDEFPEELEEGVLYISIPFTSATHLCCCGCGTAVVTPISPARWHLLFDGETVSLSPSIGNWSFPCQSHYWIKRNQAVWSGQLSASDIAELRDDQRAERRGEAAQAHEPAGKDTWPRRLKRWLLRR